MLALGAVVGCDGPTAASAIPQRDPATVEPVWSGCWLLADGQRCQLARAQVRLWFPDADPAWRWTLDDDEADPTVEDVLDGVRFSFDVSAFEDGAHTLALWGVGDEAPLFALELVPDPIATENFEFGEDVKAALASSDSRERRDVANALLAGPTRSRLEKVARVHYARALRYDARDPGGSADAVLNLLEQEEQLAEEMGLWGVRCRAALVGLYWGTYREDPALLQRWGQHEARCRDRSAALGARFDHYLGKQALHEGEYAEAQERLLSAQAIAARVRPQQTLEAGKELLDLYVRTGRWSEAQEEVASLQARLPMGTCERAEAESWIGYARIRARQSGTADLGEPGPGLDTAQRMHAPQGKCDDVALHTHDLTKLGYAASLRGDTSALRSHVDRLSEERLDGKYRHQAAELELELAVAEQRYADVPALASAMDALAEDGEPEARWRRSMILAKAAISQADNQAAQEAYVAAESVLDDLWAGVTSYAVRARWLSAYRRSALGLMRLRLDVGDLEGAACAARSARLRALDLKDELGITNEPCHRTWARGANEAVFLIVPETDDDWTVFVVVQERVVEVARVQAPAPGSDTEWWSSWADTINSASRVRILASGAALRSPLHQLAWRGEPLIRQLPVTFGLDLDPERTQQAPESPTASVVFADADPYRALDRYSDDVREAHAALERGGWEPRWLETSARPLRMADATARGGLLVYYGHGERVEVAHSAPMTNTNDVGSTALLVARNQHWGVDDVSALDRVPRWAVLLGCDVAFPDADSWSGGLNLAHALLLAGTREVLAATGPLDAAAAAELAAPLLAVDASGRLELSDALHSAWSARPDSEQQQSLAALRVWSR